MIIIGSNSLENMLDWSLGARLVTRVLTQDPLTINLCSKRTVMTFENT